MWASTLTSDLQEKNLLQAEISSENSSSYNVMFFMRFCICICSSMGRREKSASAPWRTSSPSFFSDFGDFELFLSLFLNLCDSLSFS